MTDGGRLVVIEDDTGKRYTIVRTLRAAGFSVEEAASGTEGLALVTPEIDVAILDIRLPDIDGYEVCRRIKADRATANVMVLELSATFAKSADRVRGLELGADAYLIHPVETDELVATVRALCRLRRAERERAHLARQRDLLLGALGHDLRNPLQMMSLAVDLLDGSPRLDAQEARAVGLMEGNLHRMERLISDLLLFARSETEGIPISRRPTRIGDLCRALIGDAASRFPSRSIELVDELDGSHDVDPDRMEQVLDNLLSNALNHGEGPVIVRIGRDARKLVLAVHNGGAPIAKDALATLFDPFRRASTSAKKGGVGLGLYIVDQIVRAHGGHVGVTSTEHEGTTFRVELPLS